MFNKILKKLHGSFVDIYTKDAGVWTDYLFGGQKGTDFHVYWHVYNTYFSEDDIDKIVVYDDSRNSEIYLK